MDPPGLPSIRFDAMQDFRPSSFPQPGVPPRPPRPGQPGAAAKNNGMAVASMVLGLVSLPAIFLCVGFITGLLAILFGIIGLSQIARGNGSFKGRGMAWTGILSAVAAFVIYGIFLANLPETPVPPVPTEPEAPTVETNR